SFFFNHSPPTDIYTLSLHDALPISSPFAPALTKKIKSQASKLKQIPNLKRRQETQTRRTSVWDFLLHSGFEICLTFGACILKSRSEEHTSELQSLAYLVCRLLLEKK